MTPGTMARTIDGKRYSCATAQQLASDYYFDGRSMYRNFRNTYLFRTRAGSYFACHLSLWPAEKDRIEPLDPVSAYILYERLPEHDVEAEEAFPGRVIEEA